MNKVFLTGYLANDPQHRITSKGLEQSNFDIAVRDLRNFDDSYFFSCVSWGQQAKFINSNLKKGSLVSLDGRLTRRSYVNDEGRTIYIVEIIVDGLRSFNTSGTSRQNNLSVNLEKNFSSSNQFDKPISIDEVLQESKPTSDSDAQNDEKIFDWEDNL